MRSVLCRRGSCEEVSRASSRSLPIRTQSSCRLHADWEKPSLLQHPQPQTSVCLRATAPPPPPLFGCYRPISPAALAPVASGRGRRSPICGEDLEGSPLCPQPKKSVWLLFFSPTGFFLGLPQPTRKIASLRTSPLSGLRLYVVAVEQPEASTLTNSPSPPSRLFLGGC